MKNQTYLNVLRQTIEIFLYDSKKCFPSENNKTVFSKINIVTFRIKNENKNVIS